jgi:hypothetical protein
MTDAGFERFIAEDEHERDLQLKNTEVTASTERNLPEIFRVVCETLKNNT